MNYNVKPKSPQSMLFSKFSQSAIYWVGCVTGQRVPGPAPKMSQLDPNCLGFECKVGWPTQVFENNIQRDTTAIGYIIN